MQLTINELPNMIFYRCDNCGRVARQENADHWWVYTHRNVHACSNACDAVLGAEHYARTGKELTEYTPAIVAVMV